MAFEHRIANRINEIVPSATSELLGKVITLRAQGEDIISFCAGEPDLATPEKIVNACKTAMDQGDTKYTSVAGIIELREAICEKLQKDNSLIYTPEQICVSTGAKQAVNNAVLAICNQGDEIIIPIPCWVSYTEIVRLAQGVPVHVKTNSDFSLDLNAIEEAITEKTKGIIINTPNNPTGACYDETSLRKLAALAEEYGFYVISDEVYEKLIYDDNKHVSIASVSNEAYEHTITVNGFSKSHCMTGWRIGYSAAPFALAKGIVSLQGHMTSNSTSFVQVAALEALRSCDDAVLEMQKIFTERREYSCRRISKMPGITCTRPGGAFYIMPDVSSYFGKTDGNVSIKNSADLCDYLLEKGKVAVVPGSAFEMEGTIRIAYTDSMERLAEGYDRIEAALSLLR